MKKKTKTADEITVIICGMQQSVDEGGLHLCYPTFKDLEDALINERSKEWKHIYCHFDSNHCGDLILSPYFLTHVYFFQNALNYVVKFVLYDFKRK